MAEKKESLQDSFLNGVRKDKNPVTVFLVNGVKLQGAITWFDNFSILLRRDGTSQLVYKHAISTIMPTQPLSFFELSLLALILQVLYIDQTHHDLNYYHYIFY